MKENFLFEESEGFNTSKSDVHLKRMCTDVSFYDGASIHEIFSDGQLWFSAEDVFDVLGYTLSEIPQKRTGWQWELAQSIPMKNRNFFGYCGKFYLFFTAEGVVQLQAIIAGKARSEETRKKRSDFLKWFSCRFAKEIEGV